MQQTMNIIFTSLSEEIDDDGLILELAVCVTDRKKKGNSCGKLCRNCYSSIRRWTVQITL